MSYLTRSPALHPHDSRHLKGMITATLLEQSGARTPPPRSIETRRLPKVWGSFGQHAPRRHNSTTAKRLYKRAPMTMPAFRRYLRQLRHLHDALGCETAPSGATLALCRASPMAEAMLAQSNKGSDGADPTHHTLPG